MLGRRSGRNFGLSLGVWLGDGFFSTFVGGWVEVWLVGLRFGWLGWGLVGCLVVELYGSDRLGNSANSGNSLGRVVKRRWQYRLWIGLWVQCAVDQGGFWWMGGWCLIFYWNFVVGWLSITTGKPDFLLNFVVGLLFITTGKPDFLLNFVVGLLSITTGKPDSLLNFVVGLLFITTGKPDFLLNFVVGLLFITTGKPDFLLNFVVGWLSITTGKPDFLLNFMVGWLSITTGKPEPLEAVHLSHEKKLVFCISTNCPSIHRCMGFLPNVVISFNCRGVSSHYLDVPGS